MIRLHHGGWKHWELCIGRVSLIRWCQGAPCHLPGVTSNRHPVQVVVWHRAESARR